MSLRNSGVNRLFFLTFSEFDMRYLSVCLVSTSLLQLSFWAIFKTRNGERGTGNGERGTGNGERGTGNGERGTGNGERGTGNGESLKRGIFKSGNL